MAGFTGGHCDTDIDDCVNHTCHNGGSCVDGINNYSCNCVVGFTGGRCDTDIDDCVDHSCHNGGSCVDGLNNYSCNCVAGFTGHHCETVILSSKTTATRTPAMEKTSAIVFSYNTIQVSSTSNLPSTASSPQPKESVLPTTTRSVSTSKTPPTPTQEAETEYVFKMKVLEDWKEDLKDKNSAAFKELSSRLEAEIWKEFTGTKDLTGVRVLSFRKGSVVAEFQLTYRTKILAEEVFADLKDKMGDGNLGSLRVDPASLERISPNTQEPTLKTEEPKINWPLIIGASSGGMFVLALVTICLIRSYKKKRGAQRRSRFGSQVMPAEEEFGNREKYELKDAKSDKNIVFCEEVGVWGETMEGKSNEAFD